MIVDAHVHLLPDRLAAAIRAFFTDHIADELAYPHECDAARDAILRAGVTRCWALPYVRAAGQAARLNRWMVERFADDERVVPGATVHPGDDVAAVIDEAVASGLRVLKLHCSVGGFRPDDERLDPLWRRASEGGLPVVVHAGHAVDGTTGDAEIAPVERVATRWPDVPLVLAHCAAPAVEATLALVRRTRSVHVDLAPVVRDPVALRRDLVEGVTDRVLFGSDAPNVAISVEASIARVRALGLAVDEEAAILGGNAERLLAAAG